MGTTRDALGSNSGAAVQYVLLIEGVPYALTDGPTSPVATAIASDTEITDVLGGLSIQGSYAQELTPWDARLNVGVMRFAVMDCDGNDTIGKLARATGQGTETRLVTTISTSATTIQAKRVNEFAASGSIHIGTEHITYSSKSTAADPDTFTVSARGKYAAFKANTEASRRFGRYHPVPTVANGVAWHPRITSAIRGLTGRLVGLWVLRRSGASTLDTLAQGECIFAGRILGTADTETGITVIEAEDIRGSIRDCTLLHDQYVAKVSEGIYLSAGMRFKASDYTLSGGVLNDAIANDLVVVLSGASGTNEINEGRYTSAELASAINDWLAAETAAARLVLKWTFKRKVQTSEGYRSQFRFSDGSADTNGAGFFAPARVLRFMGFAGTEDLVVFGTGAQWSGATKHYTSTLVPQRTSIVNGTIDVDDVRGTFVNNRVYLPIVVPNDGNTYGVVQLTGGAMALVRYVDADTIQIANGNPFAYLEAICGVKWNTDAFESSFGIDTEGDIEVKQVAILQGNFGTLLTSILASTGTAGYNHAAYDALPAQLGAAIPWELLGTGWTTTVNALEQAHENVTLVIDEPTRLMDALSGDWIIRFAALVWKLGGLRVGTWGTPASALSSVTLTVANKGASTSTRDRQVTVANDNDRFLCNSLKLEYNRRPGNGGYRDTIQISHPDSIYSLGVTRTKTVSMRNTYEGVAGSSNEVEALRDTIGQAIEMFARPLRLLRRTVDFSLYTGIAPGDFCTITDGHAADPATGTRGLSSKPGLIVAHRVDWGGYDIESGKERPPVAEVDVLILPLTNISAYSPAADVASYNAGSQTITCSAHAYSESSEAVDASHFEAGDAIVVLQRDPDDPAAAQSWDVVVQSVSGNDIVVDPALTGFNAGLSYVVISDRYSDAETTQTADVYQADDADAMVADTVAAYGYGWSPIQAGTWTSDTGLEQVELYSTILYGDGKPLDTYGERLAGRLSNNLVNIRTATYGSSISRSVKRINSGVRGILEAFPIFVGPGDLLTGERLLTLRPFLRRSAAGAAEKLYITVCRFPPTGTSRIITDLDAPTYLLQGPMSETEEWSVTTTTWGMGADATVSIRVADPDTGIAYVVVEGQANVESRGVNWALGVYAEAA